MNAERTASTISRPLSTLLSPLRIGGLSSPNRIIFGAHPTNFGVGNAFTPRHLAYYQARAAGGAGIIVSEALTVHPLDWPYEHIPFGHNDHILPSLEALAHCVKDANSQTLLLAQLNHHGAQTSGKLLRQSPWAPSPFVEPASKRMARQMTGEEIHQVIDGYAHAAQRVASAGLDGVELNAGQFSLIRQFLSPLTNQRDDEWGGELENRLRFALHVIQRVRQAIGPKHQLGPKRLLGLKLCGDELAPWGGLTPEDGIAIAQRLVAAGGLDYLSMQIGGPYTPHITEAAMPMPQAHAAHLAQGVREALNETHPEIPVFAEGRIESPLVAEAIVAEAIVAEAIVAGAVPGKQQADGVVMTRALISDPDLPLKLAGSHPETPRPHIAMTRYFSVVSDWNRPLGDLINPRAGREALLPEPTRMVPTDQAATPQSVLVVGGGPAGMEAARTLALQGHKVNLWEQASHLGGMAAVLAGQGGGLAGQGGGLVGHVPALAEYHLLVDYYRRELERLGVEITLGKTASTEDMPNWARVFLAIGARPPSPTEALPFALKGFAESQPPADPPLVTPRQLLCMTNSDSPNWWAGIFKQSTTTPLRCAVVDLEHGFRSAAAVEWLLAKGARVEVLTPDFYVGRGLVESAEFLWFNRVQQHAQAGGTAGNKAGEAQRHAQNRAWFHPRTEVTALEAAPSGLATLHCKDRFSTDATAFEDLALVVLAQPEIPAKLPSLSLTAHPHVVSIGDARAPRLMGEAIAHAHKEALRGW